MSELNDELTDIFRDEAAERLNQMETVLLAIESGDAPDAGTGSVDSLFRNAHTIKGAAGMLGLDDIRALAHAVEEVLAAVRDAGVFRPELAAPLLRATAALRAQVAGEAGAGEAGAGLLDDLAASKAMLAHGEAGVAAPSAAAAAAPGPRLPRPGMPGPRMPGAAESAVPAAPGPDVAGIPGVPDVSGVPAATLPDQDARAANPAVALLKTEGRPLRVPAEKIDRLLDVVGEVMQYRGRLAHALGGQSQLSQDAIDVLTGSDRMLEELKDTAIGLRTLPLEVITRRLPLAVRDLCRAEGKDVELVVAGADTEIDRLILESLYEPLAHLLRNAVSHGI